jgi:hypothetical protein
MKGEKMANNRMYLKCKGCGEEFMLAKCFGEGYYMDDYLEAYHGKTTMERLNNFFDEHHICYKNETDDNPMNWHYENGFELTYEFEH